MHSIFDSSECTVYASIMKYLTVRHVDSELSRALERERKKSGKSLNSIVLSILRRSLGVEPEAEYRNGLADQAGGWSEAEFRAFEEATSDFEKIDEDSWA